MKICIFGAASAHIDKLYIDEVEALSEKLAARGHSLVFGAGATGVRRRAGLSAAEDSFTALSLNFSSRTG